MGTLGFFRNTYLILMSTDAETIPIAGWETEIWPLSSSRATADGCSREVGCLFFLLFVDTKAGVTLAIAILS